MIIEGYDYGTIALESRADGIYLVQADCLKANKGAAETEAAAVKIADNTQSSPYVWLRVKVAMKGKNPTQKPDYISEATFSYSLDGKKFTDFGRALNIREGHWIGAKVGLYCVRDYRINDSGWMTVDSFDITKNK